MVSPESAIIIAINAATEFECSDNMEYVKGLRAALSIVRASAIGGVDSEGNGPNMPPGTRVVFMPDRDDTKLGTIERQILHHDGGESFWGNVRVLMDDGRYIEANCWQCKKVLP